MEGNDTGNRNKWKGKEDRRNLTAEGGWDGRWGRARAGNKIKGKKKKGNARPGKEGRRNVTAKWVGREGEGKTRTVNKHEWGGTERKAKERNGNEGGRDVTAGGD